MATSPMKLTGKGIVTGPIDRVLKTGKNKQHTVFDS